MPKNGFIMRFFGCVQLPVGVVGAERSYQLSYQRLFEPDQELDERQRKRMPFAVPRCLEDESAEHTLG